MCFVFIWEQTATCATHSTNWLVFITQMKSVYCAVRTGSLNIIPVNTPNQKDERAKSGNLLITWCPLSPTPPHHNIKTFLTPPSVSSPLTPSLNVQANNRFLFSDTNVGPCYGSDGPSPASHCVGPVSNPSQSMWNLRWKKRQCGQFHSWAVHR